MSRAELDGHASKRELPRPNGPVMPGLDTASRVYPTCGASYAELGQARVLWHPSKRSESSKGMDCRIKPGNDADRSTSTGGWCHTAAIASISSRKLGLASPLRMHSVLAGGCPAK